MTQKNKAVAILLVVIMALSAFSAAFCVSAAEQTCTLTIELIGDGTVSDGTTTVSSPSVFVAEYVRGDSVTLTATPGDGKAVAFWVNAATDRVFSFTDTYVFSAGSDMYMYIDFEDAPEVAAQNGRHFIAYLSEGDNILFSGTESIGSTAFYETEVAPLNMITNGKTWTGWDKTPEEVAADSGTVFVHPTYDNTVSYEITSIIGDNVYSSQGTYGGNFNLSAPETLDGESFSYWLVLGDENDPNASDQIASFSAFYQFIVVMPLTFRAVYGEEVTQGAVTRVVGFVPELENHALNIYTEWNVKPEYTVIKGGFLYTGDPSIGNSESAFVLDAHDSRIREGTSTKTSRAVCYSVRDSKWYAEQDGATGEYYYPLKFVRSFLVVKDQSGVVTTMYSPIHVADYVNVAFVGVIEDNPYPDPFG